MPRFLSSHNLLAQHRMEQSHNMFDSFVKIRSVLNSIESSFLVLFFFWLAFLISVPDHINKKKHRMNQTAIHCVSAEEYFIKIIIICVLQLVLWTNQKKPSYTFLWCKTGIIKGNLCNMSWKHPWKCTFEEQRIKKRSIQWFQHKLVGISFFIFTHVLNWPLLHFNWIRKNSETNFFWFRILWAVLHFKNKIFIFFLPIYSAFHLKIFRLFFWAKLVDAHSSEIIEQMLIPRNGCWFFLYTDRQNIKKRIILFGIEDRRQSTEKRNIS